MIDEKAQRFRKKPVEIEAIQWDGNQRTFDLIEAWAGKPVNDTDGYTLLIPTLEGTMTASLNDWIIKGVKGEIYPCKPDIFAATYESAKQKGEAEGWRDIKDDPPPMDGTPLLLTAFGGQIGVCVWIDGWRYHGLPATPADWWDEPSHWRPLPEPPTMLSAGGEGQ